MKYKISKELFEAVMDKKTRSFEVSERGIWYIFDNDSISNGKLIKFNDFFFMCKDWAYDKNNHILTSWKDRDCYYCEIDNNLMVFSDDLSEQQAVFLAASWILENKGEQQQ